MNFLNLNKKVFLITGASSGIGYDISKALHEQGAHLILTGRNKKKLELLKSELKTNCTYIVADLTTEDGLENIINNTPTIDGIVHSAGAIKPFPVKFIKQKQIDELFNINYNAPVLLTSALLKAKKINKKASLIFISSISSNFAHKGGAIYSSTKAAINSYSKTIAIEFAPKQIRSNVIEAGMVKTPLFNLAEKAVTKELMDLHEEQYPLGFGETKDVSNTVLFLLSEVSKWITGTQIVMDGGLTAGK
jgi:NAD(P)-dependent dehydrogenase (short-subunit alcohol dehydrogenase family)